MKKYSYILFNLLMLLGIASCNSPMDENPVVQKPTSFTLNTPALADQYIELTPEGTVNLTWSQPDYGYAAVADYYVQISRTEDFADFVEVNTDPITTCDAQVASSSLAEGICKLRGIKTEEAYTDEPAHELYFRVRSCIKNVKDTEIISNVVKMNKVKSYFALKLPGYIYLVGQPEGWSGPTEESREHYNAWRLFEDENAIGSKVYTGEFEIPADQAQFRFYTALTGWDKDSYGIQVDDNPVDIALTDGVYQGALVKGKGSFQIPGWEGGKMKMVVDMNKMTVVFRKL